MTDVQPPNTHCPRIVARWVAGSGGEVVDDEIRGVDLEARELSSAGGGVPGELSGASLIDQLVGPVGISPDEDPGEGLS